MCGLTRHKLHDMRIGLVENELDMLRIPIFELLLQVAASMLIFTQTVDFPFERFELNVGKASVVCLYN